MRPLGRLITRPVRRRQIPRRPGEPDEAYEVRRETAQDDAADAAYERWRDNMEETQ